MRTSNLRFFWMSLAFWICLGTGAARATSMLPISLEDHLRASAAVFRGTIGRPQSFRGEDGHIYTRVTVRVEEVFKGKLPGSVQLVHRGGEIGTEGESDSLAPRLRAGEERLLFVSRRGDGTLYANRGAAAALKTGVAGPGEDKARRLRSLTAQGLLSGEDITDQASAFFAAELHNISFGPEPAATNLMAGPARFILPDRGEPVPYLIDADSLPVGMTQSQGIWAVKMALAAWTNATSLRFVLAGMQSFGMAAINVNASDGVLRLQLHDNYNYINSPGTLGVGGRGYTILDSPSGWRTGGAVDGTDFHRTSRGYLVMEHGASGMQNLLTFTEVLTHEIGHAIGLGHSSENQFESNQLLKQAIMYYLVHADGRGAALNAWDTNVSRQIHPVPNTPPYCYGRVMDVVTGPGIISTPGVNTVRVPGYDFQGDVLTLQSDVSASGAGTFSTSGDEVRFVPNGQYDDTGRLDPAGSSDYGRIAVRHVDGVHASPYVSVRILSLNSDSYNEGIPDAWRTTYFGGPNPNSGPNRNWNEDFDNDAYNNLTEYWLGSNPANASSNLRITTITSTNMQWQAKGYEIYQVLASSNLSTWTRAINPVMPTGSVASITSFTNGSSRQVFRVEKIK